MYHIVMARFTHFSKHSLKRIDQRTKLNYFLIAEMLDHELAIDVGTEIVFDRKHWLFYSYLDDCCFVAVQDCFTGLVITVLPLDYHENLAWKIDDNQLIKAKKKATLEVPSDLGGSNNVPPSIIMVKARYMSDQGYQKTVTLAKLKASDYDSDLLVILKDELFESEVKHFCKLKNTEVADIFEVTVALGNDGEPLMIDWKSDVDE